MIILIAITVLLIIVLMSIFVGVVAVRNSIEKFQETDLMLISDIADHFLSSAIEALKTKAAFIAQAMYGSRETEWPKILLRQQVNYPEFIGMAIFGAGGKMIATAGELPANPLLLDDPNVKQAFLGNARISTTIPSPLGVVFYLATPIPKTDGSILVITLPGMFFSEMVSSFVIWETGHIFIDDAEGNVIANIRETWVQNRHNFVHLAKTDKEYGEVATVIQRGVNRETCIGFFSVLDVRRMCALRPITGSVEGWFLGLIAPIPESPFRKSEKGLIAGVIVTVLQNLITAVTTSDFTKKIFYQKERMAKLQAQVEIANRVKSSFLASMSHELRTPMNAILGLTEVKLQSTKLSGDMETTLQTIHSSGKSLMRVINDLLDLSKIEAGKLELINKHFETATLINDTINFNLPLIGNKPIEFRLHVGEDMFLEHIGDEKRIKQVLNNLLSNAFKFTSEGEVRLSAEVEITGGKGEGVEGNADTAPDVTLIFTVSDTGSGMTEEQIKSLFEEYSHTQLQANRFVEGAGLGMNIVQHLAKMMGGDISVKSAPGKGTEVVVRLTLGYVGPARLGRDLAESLMNFSLAGAHRMEKAHIEREPMPYGSVLVVDDMETNLYVAGGFLRPYGLKISTALSGEETISRIDRGEVYDIVFMDYMMPGMDGIETVKIIREKGYKHPIVALTANAVHGQAEMFMANGFDGFISKPVDLRELNASLNKFIRDKQPPEVLEAVRAVHVAEATQKAALAGGDALAVDNSLSKLFLRDAETAIVALQNYENLGDREERDTRAYITSIHALKGALVNIGEAKLSAFAKELEVAGREQNFALISRKTPAFLGELHAVLDKLKADLAKDRAGDVSDEDMELLRKMLPLINAACVGYNMGAARAALKELKQKQWSAPHDGYLDAIEWNLLSGDLKKAEEACEDWLLDISRIAG